MPIYKEGTHWRADVYVNFKRINLQKGFSTKKEAKDWHDRQLILYRASFIAGGPFENKYSVDTLLTRFEEILLAQISPSTARRYWCMKHYFHTGI